MNATRSDRTCMGCNATTTPDELERFVFVEDAGLLHDLRRKAPGRGVWVHPDAACVERAVSGGFARGLKRRVDAPPADELVEAMAAGIRRRLEENLRVAVRSGQAHVGGNTTSEAMRNDRVSLLLIASDAGEATRKKYVANAQRKGIDVHHAMNGAMLATGTRHDHVAVVGLGGDAAGRIARDIAHLARLTGPRK